MRGDAKIREILSDKKIPTIFPKIGGNYRVEDRAKTDLAVTARHSEKGVGYGLFLCDFSVFLLIFCGGVYHRYRKLFPKKRVSTVGTKVSRVKEEIGTGN